METCSKILESVHCHILLLVPSWPSIKYLSHGSLLASYRIAGFVVRIFLNQTILLSEEIVAISE